MANPTKAIDTKTRGYKAALASVTEQAEEIADALPEGVVGNKNDFLMGYATACRLMLRTFLGVSENMGKRGPKTLDAPKGKIVLENAPDAKVKK